MRKILYIVPVIAMMVVSSCCNSNSSKCDKTPATCDSIQCQNGCKAINATDEEVEEVSKALDMYVDAAIAGDSKVAEPAFAETATISHVEEGKLISLPIKSLFDYYDETGKQNASYEITALEVTGDVAIVRIDSKFGETGFDDMFTLAKDGDNWKIISKIYRVK